MYNILKVNTRLQNSKHASGDIFFYRGITRIFNLCFSRSVATNYHCSNTFQLYLCIHILYTIHMLLCIYIYVDTIRVCPNECSPNTFGLELDRVEAGGYTRVRIMENNRYVLLNFFFRFGLYYTRIRRRHDYTSRDAKHTRSRHSRPV